MYKIITCKGHNSFFNVYKDNKIINIGNNCYSAGVDISNTHKPSRTYGTSFQYIDSVYEVTEETINNALNAQIPSWLKADNRENCQFYNSLEEYLKYESQFFDVEVIDGDISKINELIGIIINSK